MLSRVSQSPLCPATPCAVLHEPLHVLCCRRHEHVTALHVLYETLMSIMCIMCSMSLGGATGDDVTGLGS